MKYYFIANSLFLLCLYLCQSVTDISWDFGNNDINSWGTDLAPKEINVELFQTNNELRGSITGPNPIIDSPSLFMHIMRRNYCVIRMAYSGSATTTRLLLLSTPTSIFNPISNNNVSTQLNSSSSPQVNISNSSLQNTDSKLRRSWEDTIIAISSSNVPGVSGEHSITKLVDSSLTTYYLANISTSTSTIPTTNSSSPSSSYIVITFDLLKNRWISSFTLFPVAGKEPKKCLLSKSLTDNYNGQYMTVKSLTVQQIVNNNMTASLNATNSTSDIFASTTVTGFNALSRYWRLTILDTYDSTHLEGEVTQVGIREVQFQGAMNDAAVVPFTISNTGDYDIYYIPMYTTNVMNNPLIGLRLEIMNDAMSSNVHNTNKQTQTGVESFKREGLAIDYIRITRAPLIWRVRGEGCINIYYDADTSAVDDFDHSIFSSPAAATEGQFFSTADLIIDSAAKYHDISFNVSSRLEYINNERPLYYYQQHAFRTFELDRFPYKYAATFDCPLTAISEDGNSSNTTVTSTDIYIDGVDFGNNPIIHVDNKLCPLKSQIFSATGSRVSTVICTLPSFSGYSEKSVGATVTSDTQDMLKKGGLVSVKIQDSSHPGLMYESKLLSYRMPPPRCHKLVVQHIRAHAVDVSWVPPGVRLLDSIATTGYKLIWRPLQGITNITGLSPSQYITTHIKGTGTVKYFLPFNNRVDNMTVGNITFTSVKGLLSNTPYQFAIAGVAEGGGNLNAFNIKLSSVTTTLSSSSSYPYATDQYGRRQLTKAALIGQYSEWTDVIFTPTYDISRTFPDSNNYDTNIFLTGNITASTTNVTNTTNASSVPSTEAAPKDPFQFNYPNSPSMLLNGNMHACDFVTVGSAAVIPVSATEEVNAHIREFIESDKTLTNSFLKYPDPVSVTSHISQVSATNTSYSPIANGTNSTASSKHNHNHTAGTNKNTTSNSVEDYMILRLTGSAARKNGAAWYPEKVNVREGFDTTFSFYLSSPSVVCNIMAYVNTLCRSRGADGLAFVIQNPDYMVDTTVYDTTLTGSPPIPSFDSSVSHTKISGVDKGKGTSHVLGEIGNGMGYSGISNGLSIEIDTYSNSDLFDPYENHIAVLTPVCYATVCYL